MDSYYPTCQVPDLQKDLRKIFDDTIPDRLVTEVALRIQRKHFSSRPGSSLGRKVQSATSLKAFSDCLAKEAASCYRLPRKHITLNAASDCTSHFESSPVLLGRVGSCSRTGQLLLSDSTSTIPCFTAVNVDRAECATSRRATGPHLTPSYIGSWILIWRFRLIIELGRSLPTDCSSCCIGSSGSCSLATAYVMFDVEDVKRVLAPQRSLAIGSSSLSALGFQGSSVQENSPEAAEQYQDSLKLEHQKLIKLPSSVLIIGKESFKKWHDKCDIPASFVIRLCSSAAASSSTDSDKICVAGARSFSLELVAEARKCMPFFHIGHCYILKKVKKRRCSQKGSSVCDLFIDDLHSLEEPVNLANLPPGIVLGTTLSSAKVGALVTCRAVVTAIEERDPKHDVARPRGEIYSGTGHFEGSMLRRQSSDQHWLIKLEDVEQSAFTAEAVVFDHCVVRHITGIVPGSVVLINDFLCENAAASSTASFLLVSATVSSIDVQTCPPMDIRTLKEQLRSLVQQTDDGRQTFLPLSFVWPVYTQDTYTTATRDTFTIHGRLAHAISLSLTAHCNKCSEVVVNGVCQCTSSLTSPAAFILRAKLFGIFEDGSCEFFGYAYDGIVPALLDLSTATWVAIGSHVAKHGNVDVNSGQACLAQQVDGLTAVLLKLVKSKTFGIHKRLTVLRMSGAVRVHAGVYTVPYKACLDAERRMWATYITKKHDMMTLKITEVSCIGSVK